MTDTGLHYATVWEAIADRIPDRPALRHGTRVVPWGDFERRSARLAAALAASGVGPGGSVAAYLYNRPEYFEVFFGALKVRAVPSNVNYRYGSGELLALLENSEAEVLVFDAELRDRVAPIVEQAPGLLLVEVGAAAADDPLPGAHAYEEWLAAVAPAPPIPRDDDDLFLSYTGGTTGLPKGVTFRIGQSLGNSLWFRDLFRGATTELGPVDCAVALAEAGTPLTAIPASPLMHSTGFIFASLPTLTAGGTVITLEGRSFDPHELLATVDTTGAQVVGIVGDAFALPIVRALDEGRPGGGAYDASSVRVICSAGVAWSAPIKERLFEHLPEVTLLDSCGSTEGVAYGTRQLRRGDVPATANFDASPGLKVLSPEGEELPQGDVGLLAGTTTASGYHRDPEKTAATFRTIGGVQYAIPGDLGRIEADGTVTLIGRGVSTINTGGEKVYPAEVEEAIRTLETVDDCVVVGVPDERFGQAVAALVVGAPGRTVAVDEVTDATSRRRRTSPSPTEVGHERGCAAPRPALPARLLQRRGEGRRDRDVRRRAQPATRVVGAALRGPDRGRGAGARVRRPRRRRRPPPPAGAGIGPGRIRAVAAGCPLDDPA
jgi:fatty-acyl-CoA synthase